ncbi:hypothetical protein NP493_764g01051 [Ridgeia piscesae]|uniref:Uncharacterized protein n=1 Tax=Ridgeia piscesae TaxID=27915 RepID=A0AAD9KQG4_RIDPI|nr:hypothetical protein NP493_764g01051 [Ridgeia piscesae]
MNGIDQGFIKSNALVTLTSHEDDNMSGSTSDSQSSIIYRGPSSNMGDTSADEGAKSDAALSPRSPLGGAPSKPHTSVWSPFG